MLTPSSHQLSLDLLVTCRRGVFMFTLKTSEPTLIHLPDGHFLCPCLSTTILRPQTCPHSPHHVHLRFQNCVWFENLIYVRDSVNCPGRQLSQFLPSDLLAFSSRMLSNACIVSLWRLNRQNPHRVEQLMLGPSRIYMLGNSSMFSTSL